MASPKLGNLNQAEEELIDRIPTAPIEEIKLLLSQPGVRVDCLDDQGITPLQHASFKGRKDLCELFLQHGADVNSSFHCDGYTALMFAGLSGKPDLVRMLLEAGAKTDPLNRVKRTAAQMAAFVKNHTCVSAINNFVSPAEMEYYSIPQGLEKEGKLPKHLVKPLVDLLNKSYLHPVKISFYLEDNPALLEDSKKVQTVLNIMCEKSMKNEDTEDVMAIKVNYYSSVIGAAAKSYNEKEKSLTPWIKSLVKGSDSNGFPEKQEKLVRQSMQEFPYTHSDLFLQFIRTVASVNIGDSPTALSVLTNCVHGPRIEEATCDTCGEAADKKCSACKMITYCDQRCQKLRYSTHKKLCAQLHKYYLEMQKLDIDARKVKEKMEKIEINS